MDPIVLQRNVNVGNYRKRLFFNFLKKRQKNAAEVGNEVINEEHMLVGGPNIVVGIDESKFVKPKNMVFIRN